MRRALPAPQAGCAKGGNWSALVEFVRWCIEESFDSLDIDGSSIQSKAVKLGILSKTKYDPEIHGESAEAEPGDEWYTTAPWLSLAPPPPVAESGGALAEFARWAITEGPFEGNDLDGAAVQEKAEKLRLLVKTKYDPAIHGESAEAEPGDDWFVFAPIVAEKRPEVK